MSKRGGGGIATLTKGLCDTYKSKMIEGPRPTNQKLKLVNRTNGCKIMAI